MVRRLGLTILLFMVHDLRLSAETRNHEIEEFAERGGGEKGGLSRAREEFAISEASLGC